MVEIRYGEQYEVADLAGQTVGEAREQFRNEFGIPDKARAKLNGSKVKESMEQDTVLNDDDMISFGEARGKGIYMIGALLLALAVTGGIFAWTATTETVDIDLGYSGEFATVTDNDSITDDWHVFANYKGVVNDTPIFVITPSENYTGDLTATIYFSNAHDMVSAYKVVMLKLVICGSLTGGANDGGIDTSDEVTGYQYLSMAKGSVSFDIEDIGSENPPFHVYIKSGFYITHHTIPSDKENLQLLCDVTQKGVMQP